MTEDESDKTRFPPALMPPNLFGEPVEDDRAEQIWPVEASSDPTEHSIRDPAPVTPEPPATRQPYHPAPCDGFIAA